MSRERWRFFLLHADRAELAGLNASAAKSRAKDVLCQLLQISSESAGGLFIPLSAARRTVFVAYVA